MSEQNELSREIEEGRGENVLPNGDYIGRLYIIAGVVGIEGSPDYARMKLIFEFEVTEGEQKGKLAFANRVLSPHYIANEPPTSDGEAYSKWRATATNYVRQTNSILGRCGVEISEDEGSLLAESIAESNRRRTIVNFTVKNGVPQINRFVAFENNEKMSKDDFRLPDGNDAPI